LRYSQLLFVTNGSGDRFGFVGSESCGSCGSQAECRRGETMTRDITNAGSNSIAKRRLGRTGLMVSEIGLGGAWLLGRKHDRTHGEGAELVRHALARGINYVDTAECYGESEVVVGLALEGYSGECFLATKFGHVPGDFDFSAASVLASVQRSMGRLRNRPIELLQLHTPPEPDWERLAARGGAFDGMREARDRGWCRFLGTTGNDVEFLRRCVETDIFDTMLVFLRYDLMDQSAAPLIQGAYDRDIGVILASPLRMGLLGAARNEMRSGVSPEESRLLESLESHYDHRPGGLPAAAMRFALACKGASIVLTGAESVVNLDQTIQAATAVPG
jgi:L-galactose dehydrogenase